VPRSSKHEHGRLVLTNTRRPWHGVHGCVCGDNYPGHDDCTLVDCLRSCSTTARLSTACSRGPRTVRSAFSETRCRAKYVTVPNNSQYKICATCVNY